MFLVCLYPSFSMLRKKLITLSAVAVIVLLTQSLYSTTILWTKDFPDGDYTTEVGSDGSVAITAWDANLSGSLFWYDVSGNLLAEIDRSQTPYVESILHVSKRDVLYYGRDEEYNRFTYVASLNEDETVKQVKINHDFPGNRFGTILSFPFFLSRETGQTNTITLTLWSVTDPPEITVVGSLLTGVSGETLHIRWKSEPRAIYKIQTSEDLDDWTDYSGEIEGDGTTKFENVPVTSETIFARVVQI